MTGGARLEDGDRSAGHGGQSRRLRLDLDHCSPSCGFEGASEHGKHRKDLRRIELHAGVEFRTHNALVDDVIATFDWIHGAPAEVPRGR